MAKIKAKTMHEEIMIPISFFACVFGILYIFFSTRHRERMNLIDKGADPELFKSKSIGFSSLKFGLTLIGVAIGILGGAIFHAALPDLQPEVGFFSMIFLFGGIAMVTSYFIERKLRRESDNPGQKK
jgi:CBS domain containing-hemolysin-like protein